MMKRRIAPAALWGALCALILLVSVSCEHKELCTSHFHNTFIQVAFDWKNAPDASPRSMRLYLYPADGSKPLVYEFSDFHGGSVEVPAGRYRAICVNSDTESILYRNIDSYDTFEAYVSDGTLVVGSTTVQPEGTERVVQPTDLLYTGRLDAFTVDALEEGQTLTLCPELSVRRNTITITGVSNLQYISPDNIKCAISGMQGGLFVGRGITTGETVTVALGMESDGQSTLTADFFSFSEGQKPADGTPGETPGGVESPENHEMTIYVAVSDTTVNSYAFDVSFSADGGDGSSGGGSVAIDSLPLPKPIVNGGGFHPDVDGWDNIDVDVDM